MARALDLLFVPVVCTNKNDKYEAASQGFQCVCFDVWQQRWNSQWTGLTCTLSGYIMPRNSKENKSENNASNRKGHTYMSTEEQAAGKKSYWTELEITGTIRNLSPNLFQLQNLTALYLKNNCLQRLPPDICQLVNLRTLDLSHNKLRSLPAEIGDLIHLRWERNKTNKPPSNTSLLFIFPISQSLTRRCMPFFIY